MQGWAEICLPSIGTGPEERLPPAGAAGAGAAGGRETSVLPPGATSAAGGAAVPTPRPLVGSLSPGWRGRRGLLAPVWALGPAGGVLGPAGAGGDVAQPAAAPEPVRWGGKIHPWGRREGWDP